MTPLFLHSTIVPRYVRRHEHLKELARATEHLLIGIDPNGTWEDAMYRIYSIGSVDYTARPRIQGVIKTPKERSIMSISSTVSSLASLSGHTAQLSFTGSITVPPTNSVVIS